MTVMASSDREEEEFVAPFSFDLCRRNVFLERQGVRFPTATTTGTTIAGVTFEGGVVLGADTRSTSGDVVASKHRKKIVYVAPNIYCCGAGTSADTLAVRNMVSSQLELHRYATGRQSRVVTALTAFKRHLFSHQGHISAALVLGGVDCEGAHLMTVYPHGSTDHLPFATMGSGSLAAMSMFESRYRENMTRSEAEALVADAIKGGIFNDLASGSNVDLCVITKDGAEMIRSFECPTPRTFRAPEGFHFQRGRTAVLTSFVEPLRRRLVVEEGAGGDSMEE